MTFNWYSTTEGRLLCRPFVTGLDETNGDQPDQQEQAAGNSQVERFHSVENRVPAHQQHGSNANQFHPATDATAFFPVHDHRAKRLARQQPLMPFLRGPGKTGGGQQYEWRGWKQRQNYAQSAQTKKNKSQ